jgi:RNA polymerase sigma-B factor
VLALIKAIDGFDPGRGTAFGSFALPSIVGALKRHGRDVGCTVRPPRELQELALRVSPASGELAASTASLPTAARVAGTRMSASQMCSGRARPTPACTPSRGTVRAIGPSRRSGALIDTIGARDVEIRRVFERVTLEALLEPLEGRARERKAALPRGLRQSEIGDRLATRRCRSHGCSRGSAGAPASPGERAVSAGVDRGWRAAGPPSELGAQRIRP